MVIGQAHSWYLQAGMQRGAPMYKCVWRVSYAQNTVPIDYCYVPCFKRRARLTFFEVWLKLDSVAAMANTADCTERQSNVTSFSWPEHFGEEYHILTLNPPHVTHLVYLSKLLFNSLRLFDAEVENTFYVKKVRLMPACSVFTSKHLLN